MGILARGKELVLKNASIRSSLRKSIHDISKSRGRRNSNLWQDYSVKVDSDFVLPSDRQYIHWLYFLEANPNVVSFDLAPGVIPSEDNVEGARGTELDAIAVYRDGHIEWHEIKAGNADLEEDQSQFQAQKNAADKAGVTYRRFNDSHLRPVAKVAMRWLSAFAYAKAIRGQEQHAVRAALVSYSKRAKAGTIGALIEAHECFDQSILLGMYVRMLVQGTFRMSLDDLPFGKSTRWIYVA